jgi:hypothetical protein
LCLIFSRYLGLILIFPPASFTRSRWVNEAREGGKRKKAGQNGVDGKKAVKNRCQNEAGDGSIREKGLELRKKNGSVGGKLVSKRGPGAVAGPGKSSQLPR